MAKEEMLKNILICLGIILIIVGIWILIQLPRQGSACCPVPNNSFLREIAPNSTYYYYYRIVVNTFNIPCRCCIDHYKYNITCLLHYLNNLTGTIIRTYGNYPYCARASKYLSNYVECINASRNITVITVR